MEMLASQCNDNFAVGTCTRPYHWCSFLLVSHISSEHVLITCAILIAPLFKALQLDHKTELHGMEMLASQYNDNFGVGTCTHASSLRSYIANVHVALTFTIRDYVLITRVILIAPLF